MTASYNGDYKRNLLLQYQILMQRRQHIERIFWSRIQILHLIQAGVLGGSFWLKDTCFAPSLLIMGIVLTIILFIICWHDWQDAQINDTRFQNLGASLGIRRTAPRWYLFNCKKCIIRTHYLFYVVVGLFIIVDLVILWYFNFWFGVVMSVIVALIALVVLVPAVRRFLRIERERS